MSKHQYTVQVLVGISVVAESPEEAMSAAVKEMTEILEDQDINAVERFSHPWVTGPAFCDPRHWGHSAIPGFMVFKNKEITEEAAI
jgi:hypothetical protein